MLKQLFLKAEKPLHASSTAGIFNAGPRLIPRDHEIGGKLLEHGPVWGRAYYGSLTLSGAQPSASAHAARVACPAPICPSVSGMITTRVSPEPANAAATSTTVS